MLPAAGATVKVTLLGRATVLVETGPMRILMDPVLQAPFGNGMDVEAIPLPDPVMHFTSYKAAESEDAAKRRIDHEILQLGELGG